MKTKDIASYFTMHGKIVYGYLLKCTGNASLAEELTQETFYQAIQSIDRYRGDCKPSVWLCQIAKHIWYKYLEKEKHRRHLPLDADKAATQEMPGSEPERVLMERYYKIEMYKKIRLLPAAMQEVIYLRLSSDLTFAEIGEIMGKSETWARTVYYRGKEKLAKEVKKYEN